MYRERIGEGELESRTKAELGKFHYARKTKGQTGVKLGIIDR